jgi:V/A-type H+-transporting ATPase subunit E
MVMAAEVRTGMDSELIALLEQEAKAERERILGEAREAARRIVDQARAASAEEIVVLQRRASAEVEVARVRARATSNLRAAAVLLQAKDEMVAAVFTAAERALERAAAEGNRYEAILRGLLAEATRGTSGYLVIECAEEDLAVVQAAARSLGLNPEFRASADVRLGVRVHSAQGRFVVENTLRSRLERAKTALIAQVAAILWGES